MSVNQGRVANVSTLPRQTPCATWPLDQKMKLVTCHQLHTYYTQELIVQSLQLSKINWAEASSQPYRRGSTIQNWAQVAFKKIWNLFHCKSIRSFPLKKQSLKHFLVMTSRSNYDVEMEATRKVLKNYILDICTSMALQICEQHPCTGSLYLGSMFY